MKITKDRLKEIIKEEIEAISSEKEQLNEHWTDSRDLCMRLAQNYAVDWDSDLQEYRARKGGDQKQCCMCGGAPPQTPRNPDGTLKGIDYFDPKDPAQKKACLGF